MPDTGYGKVYVRPDGTAVITCPHCGRQKVVSVSSYKGSKRRIKIKCGCKNIFTANLEFRKKIRKKTKLLGKYTNFSQKNRRGDIVVKNLSLDGLEFSTIDIDKFKVGDDVEVAFKLDNEDRTTIRREVVVRDIRTCAVGCDFKVSSEYVHGDGALGYYVMYGLEK
jgi:transcription elongation factor Elf1